MTINKTNAARLQSIASEIQELLGEFKDICVEAMTPDEYNRFRYKCLANCEPGLAEGHEWVIGKHSVTSLEKIANEAAEKAVDDDEETDEDSVKLNQ